MEVLGPILTIDPGSNGTGLAFFGEGAHAPTSTWVFTSNEKEWLDRCDDILKQIQRNVRDLAYVRCYIEQPAYFDSAGGAMVARRGDLAKLALFAGMCYGQFWPKASLVPVNMWKGQMPKTVVNARIRDILGDVACRKFKTHAWDAVGIGLFVRGELI